MTQRTILAKCSDTNVLLSFGYAQAARASTRPRSTETASSAKFPLICVKIGGTPIFGFVGAPLLMPNPSDFNEDLLRLERDMYAHSVTYLFRLRR